MTGTVNTQIHSRHNWQLQMAHVVPAPGSLKDQISSCRSADRLGKVNLLNNGSMSFMICLTLSYASLLTSSKELKDTSSSGDSFCKENPTTILLRYFLQRVASSMEKAFRLRPVKRQF